MHIPHQLVAVLRQSVTCLPKRKTHKEESAVTWLGMKFAKRGSCVEDDAGLEDNARNVVKTALALTERIPMEPGPVRVWLQLFGRPTKQ